MSDRTQTLTFKTQVHFHRAEKGVMEMRRGEAPVIATAPTGRVPKIARLMALAIRFDALLARGEVKDYAELARLGHVTRARVTQIMNLLQLAPDIQEQILFLPPVDAGDDPIKERQVRPIAAQTVWGKQRNVWRKTSGLIVGAE
jgi:hypothetical protein